VPVLLIRWEIPEFPLLKASGPDSRAARRFPATGSHVSHLLEIRRMKKFCVSLAVLALLGMSAAPAWAVPAFNNAFKDAFVKEGTPLAEKVAEAKCNVCHVGKDKKMKNEFGMVVAKYLKKGDFAGDSKKYDPKSDEGKKALADGLQKAVAEKSSSGKTFAERMQAGELPAAK
jgi:hypothetical protein